MGEECGLISVGSMSSSVILGVVRKDKIKIY